MRLRRIAYTSKSKEAFSKRNLLDLMHESRTYNTLDDISGVLIHRQHHFLQIIEGEPKAVDNLLSRLRRDKRHSDFKVIIDSPVDKRLFSNWAMGCADFDDPTLSLISGLRKDLTDEKEIEDIVTSLPELSAFLHEHLTDQMAYGD